MHAQPRNTYVMHSIQHVCTQQCRFHYTPGRLPVCIASGQVHVCNNQCLIEAAPGEPEVTCTWTGLVHEGTGAKVTNDYTDNTLNFRNDDAGCSRYGRAGTGYGPPNALRSNNYQRPTAVELVWGGSLVEESTPQPPAPKYSRRSVSTPRWGGKTRTAAPETTNAGDSVQRKTRRKNTTQSAAARKKQRLLAVNMVNQIFFNDEVRHKAKQSALKKRKQQWCGALKDFVSKCESNTLQAHCATQLAALYLSAAAKAPLPVNVWIANPKTPAEKKSTAPRMQQKKPANDQKEKLKETIVTFLMVGWQKLCKTQMWNKNQPDFGSYILGLLYICKAGGLTVGDTTVIPNLQFFVTHTPEPSFLTILCQHNGQKDCRSADFGRARITVGTNVIREALHRQLEHGADPIADFVLDTYEPLTYAYVQETTQSPWHKSNMPT